MKARETLALLGAACRSPARLALVLAVLAGVYGFGQQLEFLRPALASLRLWHSPALQQRQYFAGLPNELLAAADSVLPHDAGVLLLTPGRDARSYEYRLFHRALYTLTPRQVWWYTPAPKDSTWQARWWHSMPLTDEHIRAAAARHGASFVLAHDTAQLAGGQRLIEQQSGYLLQLDPDSQLARPPTGQPPLSRWWPLQLALALTVILLLGYGALALVEAAGYQPRGVEAAALAWALGAGLLSSLMLWLSALGLRLPAQTLVLSAAACASATLRRHQLQDQLRQLKAGWHSHRLARPGAASSLLCLLLTLQVAAVALQALGQPLHAWDSWVTWGMKARSIFRSGSIGPAVYADTTRAITHLDYPLLLPLLQAWVYSWLGTPDDRLAGSIVLGFYLCLVGLCYAAVRRRHGRQLALLTTLAVSSMPRIAVLAGTVYAELPLMVYSTLAVLALARWLEQAPGAGTPALLLLAAVAAGLMAWTKREGLVLLVVLCLALVLLSRDRRQCWLGCGALIAGAALFAGPWWLWARWRAGGAVGYLQPGPTLLWAHLGRLPTIMQVQLDLLLSSGWNFSWPLVALAALLGRLSASDVQPAGALTRNDARHLLLIVAVLYPLVMNCAYLFSAVVPYEQHLASSAYRLLAQVAALPLLWLMWAEERSAI